MKVIFFIVHKCSHCKKNYKLCAFRKEDKILKLCIKCRNIIKKSHIKTKCIHDKRKDTCKDCNGSSICQHHKQKSHCKLCNDPIDLTIRRMIIGSKKQDKKLNLFDELNFVDYLFLKNLINNCNNKCYYCSCVLQYKYYNNTLGTIERINNNLGHIKSNCVFACRNCNCSRVGSRINPQE